MSDLSDALDALWICMQARSEERTARGENDAPDSWDYFGRSYFDAIAAADDYFAIVLTHVVPRHGLPGKDTTK